MVPMLLRYNRRNTSACPNANQYWKTMPRKNLPSLLIGVSCLFSAVAALAQQPDRDLLAAAEKSKPAYVADLATLVNIDSGTDDGAGLAKVGAFLAQRLKELGANVEVLDSPPAAGKTVLGTFEGTGSRKLMLMVHYDTVFSPGDAAKRPFRVDGGKAFGPGVADAKGGALMILHALAIARERGFRDYKTLTVLFNPDEEKSSRGSRETIRRVSAQQDAVLSYEPPDTERVIVATNGIAFVQLSVAGLASHAGSAPEKGRNAALELSHQIVQLRDLGNAEKGTTVNWTLIKAGERANIIPDQASATADMRMSDVGEIARVQAAADAIIANKLVPETQVSVKVESQRPPFARNPGTDRLASMAVQVYQELGRTLQPVAMRYGTDAGFAYHAGSAKPVVLDGLGIVGDRLHSPDEWADLDSVAPRLYLSVRLLELLAKAKAE
jgi:glutamate carboxypeptidase